MTTPTAEGFRFLEHVTDALIEAWGPSLERALAQAGLGFFETMVDVAKVRPRTAEEMRAMGHDELELVYNWLEELLLAFEIRRMVFREFELDPIKRDCGAFHLEAKAKGELYDPSRHGARVGVKGVTYHNMAVDRNENMVLVRFLLDL